MLVRVVRDWEQPTNFFRQTPGGVGRWDEVQFTEDAVEECDYLIVLQRPPYEIRVKVPTGNTWLITQEPPVDYFRFYSKSFPFFDRVFTYYLNTKHPCAQSLQPVLPWHVNKSYDELKAMPRPARQTKKNELIWITSNKSGFDGQKARMSFKDFLINTGFDFRLLGRGFQPVEDKFQALYPAQYLLSVESYSTNDYWTEKLTDGLLSWCLPFYWGAPNLEKYFPAKSFIRIDIHKPEAAKEIISEAMASNEWEKRLGAIEEARNLVLDRYQFFPFISSMVKEDLGRGSDKERRNFFIPANPIPRTHAIRNQFDYYKKRVLGLFH